MSSDIILGVVSDTHRHDPRKLLPAGISDALAGVSLILHAGDLTDYSVIEDLETIAPVQAVYGNMDPVDLHSRLPSKRLLSIGGKKIGLIHGWGAPWGLRDRVRREFQPAPDIIVYGHSHVPFAGEENGIFFFNPGAVAQKALGPGGSVGRLIIGDDVRGEIIPL